MAQHIPTTAFKQKAFRTIENGIRHAFMRSRGLMKSSFVYTYLNEQEGREVYITYRKVPAGILAYIGKATIEVHYDKKRGEVAEIYLVA